MADPSRIETEIFVEWKRQSPSRKLERSERSNAREPLAAQLLAALRGTHAYVCGLERMVSSVRDLLRTQMSIPRAQVHSERYD